MEEWFLAFLLYGILDEEDEEEDDEE